METNNSSPPHEASPRKPWHAPKMAQLMDIDAKTKTGGLGNTDGSALTNS